VLLALNPRLGTENPSAPLFRALKGFADTYSAALREHFWPTLDARQPPTIDNVQPGSPKQLELIAAQREFRLLPTSGVNLLLTGAPTRQLLEAIK